MGAERWEGSWEAAGSPEAPRLPARPEALQAKSGSSLWEQQTTLGRLLWPCPRGSQAASFTSAYPHPGPRLLLQNSQGMIPCLSPPFCPSSLLALSSLCAGVGRRVGGQGFAHLAK